VVEGDFTVGWGDFGQDAHERSDELEETDWRKELKGAGVQVS